MAPCAVPAVRSDMNAFKEEGGIQRLLPGPSRATDRTRTAAVRGGNVGVEERFVCCEQSCVCLGCVWPRSGPSSLSGPIQARRFGGQCGVYGYSGTGEGIDNLPLWLKLEVECARGGGINDVGVELVPISAGHSHCVLHLLRSGMDSFPEVEKAQNVRN